MQSFVVVHDAFGRRLQVSPLPGTLSILASVQDITLSVVHSCGSVPPSAHPETRPRMARLSLASDHPWNVYIPLLPSKLVLLVDPVFASFCLLLPLRRRAYSGMYTLTTCMDYTPLKGKFLQKGPLHVYLAGPFLTMYTASTNYLVLTGPAVRGWLQC